jgi:hypothetical protein
MQRALLTIGFVVAGFMNDKMMKASIIKKIYKFKKEEINEDKPGRDRELSSLSMNGNSIYSHQTHTRDASGVNGSSPNGKHKD